MITKRKLILLTLGTSLMLATSCSGGGCSRSGNADVDALNQEIEALKLEKEQLALNNEYEQLNSDFAQFESQAQFIVNDHRSDSLQTKYDETKQRVQKLLKEIKELKGQKSLGEKRISELQAEVATLKGIMRHYIEIIDSLKKENQMLRDENAIVKDRNEKLSSQVADVKEKNTVLNQRMALAEKLNVSAVTLTPIGKKEGKVEKKLKNVRTMKVSFSIPQNNSTPVGSKTIYMRLVSPEGNLLGPSGSFRFEGSNVPYTASKVVEYEGQEVQVTMYWTVDVTLTAGDYKVELFADNYRLASRSFTIAGK